MLRVALNAAAVAGLNATYTVQLAPAASEGPQVFSASKSVGFVPVSVIEDSVSVAVPPFVRLTGCASEVVPCFVVGKAIAVVLSLTEGALVPVPFRVTFCGDPVAVSVTLSVPESDAAEAGANAT